MTPHSASRWCIRSFVDDPATSRSWSIPLDPTRASDDLLARFVGGWVSTVVALTDSESARRRQLWGLMGVREPRLGLLATLQVGFKDETLYTARECRRGANLPAVVTASMLKTWRLPRLERLTGSGRGRKLSRVVERLPTRPSEAGSTHYLSGAC